jgi:two-component system, chemotaxis family, protein-glutamate methylesterase/glutaminase
MLMRGDMSLVQVTRVDAVVIGGSSGGVEALGRILPALGAELAVPVIVVLHQPASRPSLLAQLFRERCPPPVREAEDKLALEPGVWFAPAGYHLYVEAERSFALSVDASEHFVRPAVDVLFDSAAQTFGARLAALVLTGANDDGALGARSVRKAGGLVMVQDPSSAVAPEMPRAAISLADPQIIAPLDALGALLSTLVASTRP